MVKIVKITRYVRKRSGRAYEEYKMTAPKGRTALLIKIHGKGLRGLGGFGDAYLLIVDPSDELIRRLSAIEPLGVDVILVISGGQA